MKQLVKTTLVLITTALLVVPASAQQRPGERGSQREKPGQHTDRLRDVPAEVRSEAQIAVFDEYLDLTDVQKENLIKANNGAALRADKLRGEKINRQKKMGMARELRNEHQQAIHNILTKEQYSIFLDKREAIQYDIRQRLKDYTKTGD